MEFQSCETVRCLRTFPRKCKKRSTAMEMMTNAEATEVSNHVGVNSKDLSIPSLLVSLASPAMTKYYVVATELYLLRIDQIHTRSVITSPGTLMRELNQKKYRSPASANFCFQAELLLLSSTSTLVLPASSTPCSMLPHRCSFMQHTKLYSYLLGHESLNNSRIILINPRVPHPFY